MPKLSLSGGVYGKTGTAVSLAQATDTGTLAAPALGWNVARGNIAVTISEAPTHLPKYAPYFCEFDIVADGVTDQMVSVDAWNKRYQSIFFKTTFGDPGSLHRTTKILNQHRDRNVSFTPGKPAHVYEAPGTYTVTSELCDLSGNTGSATYSFTVIDPEDPVLGYPANRTIVVDTAGNFTGAPLSDANNKVTTWEAALARAENIYATTSGAAVRIMLRGGQTFAHTINQNGSLLRDNDHIWIGR
ncbi:hypothetical protein ACOI1H_07285 [Loktanella sp. DJP18]|uniref:hypothetical protein n=1 Tax=Loktanella sp. DJP18 TaxID=3409788 RepID=UPI003BB4D7FC